MDYTKAIKIFSGLEPELRSYFDVDPPGGMIWHPLVVTPVSNIDDVTRANERLRLHQRAVTEAERLKDWIQAVSLHASSWRLNAFLKYMDLMSDQEYWELLRWVFNDTESPNRTPREWLLLLQYERPGGDSLMDSNEHARLQELPEVVAVYQCYQGEKRHPETFSVSWTLSAKMARWYANQFYPLETHCWLATGVVRKSDVLALFNVEDESEVVIDPETLLSHENFGLAPVDEDDTLP